MADAARAGGVVPTPTEPAEPGRPGEDSAEPRPWLRKVTEPFVLFPLVATLLLGTLWIATLYLIRAERENAHRSVQATSHELLETYEAQVVRVLREIDQTLKSLQLAYELRGSGPEALRSLDDGELLPPRLVYTVRVADASGEVVAATAREGPADLSGREVFRRAREADTLVMGPPERVGEGGWRLAFGRRLDGPGGSFGGLALVELDASFFVSGYEASKLGERGVLAILGTDGIFRARRTGDRVHAGDRVAFDSVVTGGGQDEVETVLSTSAWDGVARYTSARRLYAYPLAVMVGLSRDEQLAGAEEKAGAYVERAAGGSLALLLIVGILGRLSWKLERVRQRESEARAAHARRIEHLAYHDGLTGLPNRSFLSRLLEERIRRAREDGTTFALLFLDLDRFKAINDSYGHTAGDRLLASVARDLAARMGPEETVVRLGGDEFVVLTADADGSKAAEEEVAGIVDALRRPSGWSAPPYHLSVSVGAVLFEGERPSGDGEDLLRCAGLAMYRAKRMSGISCRFFDPEEDGPGLGLHQNERDLRRGLEADEFRPVYQPIVCLETGELRGLEVLARWDHPERGTLSARDFIPLAEESGLVLSLGRVLLEGAFRDFGAWSGLAGRTGFRLLVNLSARQLDDERLPDFLRSRMERHGIAPASLACEVTETELMRNTDRLTPLRELGVGILVDDFGTGYSSLGYLRELDVDGFKIDRSFVQGAARHEDDRAIVETIVTLGRRLGLDLIAEGIERPEQAELLRELGCPHGQGYHLGRPMRAAAVAGLIARGRAAGRAAPRRSRPGRVASPTGRGGARVASSR